MKKITLASLALPAALAAFAAAPLTAQPFQKFVAVGDSLIIGEESACVVQRFQQRSWVTLAAGLLGQSNFQQPFISELAPPPPLTGDPCLGAIFTGTSISVGVVSQTGTNQNAALATPYNNLGFNGSPRVATFVDLKVSHPGPGRDLQNKAATVLRNCEGCLFEGMSAVDEANSLGPDLVAFWGGANDALDAVLAGVAIEGVTLTPVDAFAASYNEVMAGLASPGRTVVAFNIPQDLPFTTTIPPVVVNPATLQPVIVNGQPVPLLGPGDDAYPCDPAPPCGLPPGTLVTLSASPLLSQGIGIPASLGGTGLPLPHGSFSPGPPPTVSVGVVLYPDDVSAIASHIEGFNGAIAASTTAYGAVLVDANALFARLSQHGFTLGGITVTTKYLTGGIFSYDGIHPSAIGYGIIAQEFVRALNAATGADVPEPNFLPIFFTPNVYSATGTVQDGGPFGYALSTWRQLLAGMQLPNGIAIQPFRDPTRLALPAGPDRKTRVGSRRGELD